MTPHPASSNSVVKIANKLRCKVTAYLLMPDGYSRTTYNIHIDDALSLATSIGLELSKIPKENDDNFCYAGEYKNLFLQLRYRNGQFSLNTRGSIQKLIHRRNDIDFPFGKLNQAIAEIDILSSVDGAYIIADCEKISIEKIPKLAGELEYLEIGINVTVPDEISDIEGYLNYNLISHRNVHFVTENNVHLCKHDRYHLKIYAKDERLVRFEVKFMKTELKRYKIWDLADITLDSLPQLHNRLKNEMMEILWLDDLNIYVDKKIDSNERILLLEADSRSYRKGYLRYRQQATKKEKSRIAVQQCRHRKKVKQIIMDKGKGYSTIFRGLITDKIENIIANIKHANKC